MDEPTPEQEERLAAITDPTQRRALESAIARGEDIPNLAWTPIRRMTDEQQAAIGRAARDLVERFGARAPDLIAGADIDEGDALSIDLSFRPETYWPDQDSLELRIGRIRGEQRRRRADALLRAGKMAELEQLLSEGSLAESLTDEDREAWGSLQPSNLGGEYLPPPEEGEVEIARVTIASTTGDVQSVRARSEDGKVLARIVDEYGTKFITDKRSYDQPLTLGELIEVIDAADVEGSGSSPGGIVLGTIRDWFRGGEDPDRLLNAAQASSSFYPDLAAYYTGAAEDLISELRSTAS